MNCKFCDLLKENNNETFICKMGYGSLYLNINQIFRGRSIYIFHEHIKDVTFIDIDKFADVDREIIIVSKVLKKIFKPQLMNVASLGNHVQHLHWHIIPRYSDDPNWGNPPWPHGEKILTPPEYKKLTEEIYQELKQSLNCCV